MKQIVIISGKGGTGKTAITGASAALAKNKVMADAMWIPRIKGTFYGWFN